METLRGLLDDARSSGDWNAVADWCEAYDWSRAEEVPVGEYHVRAHEEIPAGITP